jgi:hypothetical protein
VLDAAVAGDHGQAVALVGAADRRGRGIEELVDLPLGPRRSVRGQRDDDHDGDGGRGGADPCRDRQPLGAWHPPRPAVEQQPQPPQREGGDRTQEDGRGDVAPLRQAGGRAEAVVVDEQLGVVGRDHCVQGGRDDRQQRAGRRP